MVVSKSKLQKTLVAVRRISTKAKLWMNTVGPVPEDTISQNSFYSKTVTGPK